MTPLRVLHVISTLRAYGAERQVLELLPALGNNGLQVGALAVYNANLSPEDERSLNATAMSVGRRERGDYGFMPALVQGIRSFRPDIVHTHTHVGKYWGRPAAKLAGARFVVHTEHNPCDPARNLPQKMLDRLYGGFTNRFVVFFPEQREFLSRMEAIAPGRIAVIANGLADSTLKPRRSRGELKREFGIAEDRLAIMMVSRLHRQKNHDLAFRAIARLTPQLRERVALYVIGSGHREQELRELQP